MKQVVECIFFQAEDGIRDLTVTGVQTCALPICSHSSAGPRPITSGSGARNPRLPISQSTPNVSGTELANAKTKLKPAKIGRASCRERVKISVVAVSL